MYICVCVCVCVCVWRQFYSTSALAMDNCLTPSYPSSRSRGRPHGFTGCCGKDRNFVLINNLYLNSWSSSPYDVHCTEQFLLTVSGEFRNNLMVSVLPPLVEFGTSQIRNRRKNHLTTTSINFPFWLFFF